VNHPNAQQTKEPQSVEEALAPELNGLRDGRSAARARAETRFRYFQESDDDTSAAEHEIDSAEEALSTK
jgi:hypothetical protein